MVRDNVPRFLKYWDVSQKMTDFGQHPLSFVLQWGRALDWTVEVVKCSV